MNNFLVPKVPYSNPQMGFECHLLSMHLSYDIVNFNGLI